MNPESEHPIMNEYHKKRSLEAQKAVKEMQKKPLSREEVFEQQRKIQEAIDKSNIEWIEHGIDEVSFSWSSIYPTRVLKYI